jgi:maltose O-acetyltransferase
MSKIKKTFYLILYYGLFRHLPASFSKFGRVSSKLRYWACSHIFEYCGINVNIEKGAWFGRGAKIRIGNYSGLGINSVVPDGSIIGNDVMMGPNCFIHSQNHAFDRIDIPMRLQGYKEPHPIIIDDDVWIGRDVTIMVGRHISKGSIIAANSVLTKDYPEYSIIGGNPAKLIKSRI